MVKFEIAMLTQNFSLNKIIILIIVILTAQHIFLYRMYWKQKTNYGTKNNNPADMTHLQLTDSLMMTDLTGL